MILTPFFKFIYILFYAHIINLVRSIMRLKELKDPNALSVYVNDELVSVRGVLIKRISWIAEYLNNSRKTTVPSVVKNRHKLMKQRHCLRDAVSLLNERWITPEQKRYVMEVYSSYDPCNTGVCPLENDDGSEKEEGFENYLEEIREKERGS